MPALEERGFGLEEHRLALAMLAAILGAATGNAFEAAVARHANTSADVCRGTWACNLTFAFLALSLPALSLRSLAYERSVLLQSFAGSFCGAASAFATHCTDTCAARSAYAAAKNVLANVLAALIVLLLGSGLERLVASSVLIDRDASGVVDLHELHAYVVDAASCYLLERQG